MMGSPLTTTKIMTYGWELTREEWDRLYPYALCISEFEMISLFEASVILNATVIQAMPVVSTLN